MPTGNVAAIPFLRGAAVIVDLLSIGFKSIPNILNNSFSIIFRDSRSINTLILDNKFFSH